MGTDKGKTEKEMSVRSEVGAKKLSTDYADVTDKEQTIL